MCLREPPGLHCRVQAVKDDDDDEEEEEQEEEQEDEAQVTAIARECLYSRTAG